MTANQLRPILAELNADIFSEFFEGVVLNSDDIYASLSSKDAALKGQERCCAGKLRGQPADCRDLARHITLTQGSQTPPQSQVAVGWALDPDTVPEDRELPVVVAVGINYGQGSDYLNNPVPWQEVTQMRPRLAKAGRIVHDANTDTCPSAPWPEAFHLVAGNFFPWITVLAWAEHRFNGLEESLLLHCHGFRDPQAHLAVLLRRLGAEVTHLIFHGTNTPVPLLGTEFVRRHGDLLTPVGRAVDTQVIFCDNLARPSLPVDNSVELCLERAERREPTC